MLPGMSFLCQSWMLFTNSLSGKIPEDKQRFDWFSVSLRDMKLCNPRGSEEYSSLHPDVLKCYRTVWQAGGPWQSLDILERSDLSACMGGTAFLGLSILAQIPSLQQVRIFTVDFITDSGSSRCLGLATANRLLCLPSGQFIWFPSVHRRSDNTLVSSAHGIIVPAARHFINLG